VTSSVHGSPFPFARAMVAAALSAVAGCGTCSSVTTLPSSTATGAGGHGGSHSCGALLKCAPDERCGYDLSAGCNAPPVCRKLQSCCTSEFLKACRCSDGSISPVSDCGDCGACAGDPNDPQNKRCADLFEVPVYYHSLCGM